MGSSANHVIHPRVALTHQVEINNGAHIMYTSSDMEKYIENAVSFLSTGLRLGHGVVFIDEITTYEQVRKRLIEKGIQPAEVDRIIFAENAEFYRSHDIFNIQRVVSTFSTLIDPFIRSGIPLRTWAKVVWKEEQHCLHENLSNFEREADAFVSKVNSFSICAYDGSKLSGSMQLEIMRSHPCIMTDTELFPSILYHREAVAPSLFMEETFEAQLTKLQNEFQNTHAYYKDVIEEMPDAVLVSSNKEIVYINKAAAALLEGEACDLLKCSIWDLVPSHYSKELESRLKKVEAGEKVPLAERQIQTLSGKWIDVEVVSCPFFFESINQFAVISIIRDITYRKQIEKELKSAVKKAEESNHMKTVFLSQMSHDLRTPLNVIQGFTQILLSAGDRKEQERQQLQKIEGATLHLLGLIKEILDFSAMETGTVKLSMERIFLQPFLEDCVSSLYGLIDGKMISFAKPIQPDLAIEADAFRLKQVLHNLLTNALMYNRQGGEVRIDVRQDASGVVIQVSDAGIGIAQEEMEFIFEPFYRGKKHKENGKGTGLGLAIVAKLTTIMNGQYGVVSRENEGATFWVRFKAASGNSTANWVEAANPRNIESRPIKRKTILYIEDHWGNIEVMKAMMDVIGDVALFIETTGSGGIHKAVDLKPDLILVDLGLPDMHGLEVVDQLKMHEASKHIPVIVVSADALETSREEALKRGCVDYITKPIVMNQLRAVIEDIP